MISKYFAATALAVLLMGCVGNEFKLGSAAAPPSDVKVQPGDSSVTVTWTNVPGVQYWLFTAQSNDVTPSNWNSLSGGRAMIKVNSPVLVTGLVNGLTYAFTVNARTDDGPGGAGSPSQTAVARLAGANWTVGAPLAGDLRGLAFGSMIVAVGARGALYSSADFNPWTPPAWVARTNPLTALPDLNATVYGIGKYIAVGAGGAILSSSDALTWTTVNSGTTNTLYGVTTNLSGGFIAVGEKGTIITSVDGVTWTTVTSGTTNDLFGITYGNGAYVAVGANGTMLSSADASSWTKLTSNTSVKLNSIAYGVESTTAASQYVAVGDAGTLLSSTDGTSWTVHTSFTSRNLNSVTYNRQFVAVGDAGALFTSTSGGVGSWQAQISGTTRNLSAVYHNVYGLTAVGAAGTNLTSL